MLEKHPEWLTFINIFTNVTQNEEGKKGFQKGKRNSYRGIGPETISAWINKNGNVVNHQTVFQDLKIKENLDPELEEQVEEKKGLKIIEKKV